MAESQNIEYKESWRDEYLKWVCGFANAQGGIIYIGINDNGKVVGVADAKRLLVDIPNKIQNQLGIVCDVDLLKEKDKEYIRITVQPYDIAISYHGAYHYRSGSTKQELKGQALQDFLLKKLGKTWDDVVESKARIQDIDTDVIKIFLASAIKTKRMAKVEADTSTMLSTGIKLVLDNLRLTQGKKLKRAALLLFGKDPQKFFINAIVKIGRFGQSDADLKYQEVIEGNIFKMVDEVLSVLRHKFLVASISYEGIQRVEQIPYPEAALREIVLNAIAHRDYFGSAILISVYNDKLIVWNKGSLPEGLTIDKLRIKHSSHPHNPLIADVFFKGGLIEAWGRGTIKIIEECKAAGLPEPTFEQTSGGFQVTLYADKWNGENLKKLDLNERQIKAIMFIKENKRITNSQYQKINSCSRNTATNDLKGLVDKKIIIQKGSGVGAGSGYSLIAQ